MRLWRCNIYTAYETEVCFFMSYIVLINYFMANFTLDKECTKMTKTTTKKVHNLP